MLQRLTIDATSRDDLLLRLHAAQTGFRDEGLQLDLPAVADDDRLAALGPRLAPDTVQRLRRIVCPTTAAAVMLPRDGRRIRELSGTYRIPSRARPLLKAGILAGDHHPQPLTTALPDHHGQTLGARQMANLVERVALRLGLPAPLAARPSRSRPPSPRPQP